MSAKTGINYPDLEPGNKFWNRVRVPGSCYKSLVPMIHTISFYCSPKAYYAFLKLIAFSRLLAPPSGSPKCLRFGLWPTLCTLNIYLLTYLLTRLYTEETRTEIALSLQPMCCYAKAYYTHFVIRRVLTVLAVQMLRRGRRGRNDKHITNSRSGQ